MFNITNIVILLFLVICNKEYLCDICKTCTCSITDVGPIVDCHERHLGTNEILNFDLLTLNHHQPLNKLILSKNSIVLLSTHVLNNLKHLKKLDLSQNHVDNIHIDLIFKNLKDLEDLDCSNNLLRSFDISTLNAVPSLAKLNLSHNHIGSLERSSQNRDEKLRILDLSYNNLTNLRRDFLNSLMELEYLDLSFNKLTSLQTDFLTDLQYLKVLHISNNHLRFLNLQDLPSSLIELHAGDNSISTLSFKQSLIRVLSIENNQISDLWENLTLLEELKHLNLSGNYLSDFSFALKKVELLDLSFNNLSVIPESISTKNFPMLKIFSVSGNFLKDISIRSELRLEMLEASFVNTIKEINEEMFSKLRERENSCINVIISNNIKLSILGENIFQHMNICSLDLSNNHLAYLPWKLIYNNKTNAKYLINLQRNPFVCNCSLQWMLDDLIPFLYATKPSLLEDLRCAGPLPLTNKRLVHWYQWKDKVFCDNFSEQMMAVITGTSGQQVVTFETSPGMLAVLGSAIAVLAILTIIGILLTRKMLAKRRRMNRRF